MNAINLLKEIEAKAESEKNHAVKILYKELFDLINEQAPSLKIEQVRRAIAMITE